MSWRVRLRKRIEKRIDKSLYSGRCLNTPHGGRSRRNSRILDRIGRKLWRVETQTCVRSDRSGCGNRGKGYLGRCGVTYRKLSVTRNFDFVAGGSSKNLGLKYVHNFGVMAQVLPTGESRFLSHATPITIPVCAMSCHSSARRPSCKPSSPTARRCSSGSSPG
jgi:hypothetical protein